MEKVLSLIPDTGELIITTSQYAAQVQHLVVGSFHHFLVVHKRNQMDIDFCSLNFLFWKWTKAKIRQTYGLCYHLYRMCLSCYKKALAGNKLMWSMPSVLHRFLPHGLLVRGLHKSSMSSMKCTLCIWGERGWAVYIHYGNWTTQTITSTWFR